MASTSNPPDQEDQEEALTEAEYDEIWNAKHKLAQERRAEIDEYIVKLQELFNEIDKKVQVNAILPFDNQFEANEKRTDLSNCRDSALLTITNWVARSGYDTTYVRPRIIQTPVKPQAKPKPKPK